MKRGVRIRSVRTEHAGRKYDSKREARYAQQLEHEKRAGKILGWLEQVPFRLPGTTYKVDFMVVDADGGVRFVEVKGHETEKWQLKMRAMREVYPWAEIEVVK